MISVGTRNSQACEAFVQKGTFCNIVPCARMIRSTPSIFLLQLNKDKKIAITQRENTFHSCLKLHRYLSTEKIIGEYAASFQI